MKRATSSKHQAVRDLKILIRVGRKLARQINRKLESLANINKMKATAKQRLIELYKAK